MAKVTAFEVGYCTHAACMALKGAGLKSRCFPSRAYLMQTAQGMHLWDTGYASHFQDAARGIYRLYPMVTPIHLDEQKSILRQLRDVGVHPGDLSSIVVSHFHADHIAGLRDFPNARIVCAEEAWKSVQGLKGLQALRKAFLPGLIPPDMSARIAFTHELQRRNLPPALLPFKEGRDLSGTGEVFLVPLPGHAIGHIGAFVQEGDGWTMLAADAAWAPENFTQLRGPSEITFLVQDSRSSFYATLRKLQQLHSSGVNIQLTHQQAEPMAT
jgi:glyoxylase-like metal-dependent hydrolase (beta-lactamase superfamily II)